MTTYTAAAGGGNWSANATWGGAGHPVAGDTAIIASTSGTVVVDVASACSYLTTQAAKIITVNASLTISADLTISNTMTFNGAQTVYVGGSVINTTRAVIAGAAPFVLNGTGTIAGISWYNSMTINTAGTITFKAAETSSFGLTSGRTYTYTAGTVITTNHVAQFYGAGAGTTINTSGMTWTTVAQAIDSTFTLASDLNVTNFYMSSGTGMVTSYNIIYTGNFNINCANLYGYKSLAYAAGYFKLTAGYSLNVSTSMTLLGAVQGTPFVVSSGSAGTKFNLAYSGTMANSIIYNTSFTDVNYTGVPCYAWYSAAPSNCTGIKNVTGADIGGGGVTIINS